MFAMKFYIWSGRAGSGGMLRACCAALLLAARLLASAPCAPLCHCRGEHFSCDHVPFHRFPPVPAGARHVAVSGARLGALHAAALDARALRTLVLPACRLHALDRHALASMTLTLASLDLGHNQFTELPLEALRDLQVLNWLDLQNNDIADLEPDAEWGALADSLGSLSLAENQLVSLGAGALAGLRRLAQLDLEGNRLLALQAGALPPAAAALRLARNLLPAPPCAALRALPRLRELHLRANTLRAAPPAAPCRAVDSLDLAANELDDSFALELRPRAHLRRLILDLNSFTTIPPWLLEGGARLERLSMSHNRVARVSEPAARALRALQRLDLDHNALTEPPAALRALTALRHLDLAHNELREMCAPPPRLRFLSLAGNLLGGVPRALRELATGTLLHLDLGYNRITALESDAFGAWAEALGSLSLRGNALAHLAPHAFPATLPLRSLALSFNDLDRVEAGALANLTALQTLELSSALLGGEFPSLGADAASWLQLDNNNIRRVSAGDLLALPALEYLDLDFNKIVEFPGEALSSNASRLRELRLSYNRMGEVRSNFLRESPELQSVDLSYNRIREVSEGAFRDLPALQQLSLAGNRLERLAPAAFRALPRLDALDLSDNHLAELSAASFDRVSGADAELTLNASRNRIAALLGGAGAEPAAVAVLDLEHNLLSSLQPDFFAHVGARVRSLRLAHNRLAQLDGGALAALPRLQLLTLGAARLGALRRRALAAAPGLAALDLERGELAALGAEQFRGLRQLRHLRLAGNGLRALPPDCLRDTLLEHLDLADNRLEQFPASALAAVGFTLRSLSLARNRLEHLDAAMFRACAELRDLSLAGNRLTALPDNALAPLAHLTALDLSGNRLKANFGELLRGVPRLRRLALASAGLRTAPALPLPELVELDLGGNRIAALRETDGRRFERLRTLLLADNAFTSLRPSMWAATPRLASLDVSGNPIVRVSRGALEGLPRLRSLRLERLRRLEALEPRALRPLPALRALALRAGGGGAALAAVLAEAPALEELVAEVDAAALGAQLAGVRGARLREVEVRGARLQRVAPDAFASLGGARALTLRLRGTGVARLPAGLAAGLARVPHLALDFSDNALVEFAPSTLHPNLTGRNRLATKLLPGGLMLAGNPLRCGCAVSWMGGWLRRWAVEAGGGARAARRAASCWRAAGGPRTPLLALEEAEEACAPSALAARAPRAAPRPARAAPALLLLLLHALARS